MPTTTNDLVHLTAGGVSVVLDCRDGALPAVVHWGAALGALAHDELVALADADVAPVANNEADVPVRLALLPEPHRGWTGRPGSPVTATAATGRRRSRSRRCTSTTRA